MVNYIYVYNINILELPWNAQRVLVSAGPFIFHTSFRSFEMLKHDMLQQLNWKKALEPKGLVHQLHGQAWWNLGIHCQLC